MAKSNLKSVRLSDEVLAYVEAFPGEGFNQKFENMVLFCMTKEKSIKDSVRTLEKEKQALIEEIEQFRKIRANMSSIDAYLKTVASFCKNAQLPNQLAM